MKITIERKPKEVRPTCINSYDLMNEEWGTWFNAYGVSYIGALKDHERLSKIMDLTPFTPLKDFSFLGKFHVDNLTKKFGKWVDTE